jgi:hypothetical protein
MGIIGTLYESESSFTRFCYDAGQIIAVYQGMSGHQDGGEGEEILAEAGNFDEACRWVACVCAFVGMALGLVASCFLK